MILKRTQPLFVALLVSLQHYPVSAYEFDRFHRYYAVQRAHPHRCPVIVMMPFQIFLLIYFKYSALIRIWISKSVQKYCVVLFNLCYDLLDVYLSTSATNRTVTIFVSHILNIWPVCGASGHSMPPKVTQPHGTIVFSSSDCGIVIVLSLRFTKMSANSTSTMEKEQMEQPSSTTNDTISPMRERRSNKRNCTRIE